MEQHHIGLRRLHSQAIARHSGLSPAEMVTRLGAMQAQDYLGALWAVALRTPDATERDVEQAIADREIVRTWPMRGTLHFVAAADARWMLKLLTPRVIAASASRHRQLGIDEQILDHSQAVVTRALEGSHQLARPELYEELESAGIATTGQRGIHILGNLAQRGLICFGPRHGKQPSFVLLDEWVPQTQTLERDEAIAELTRRYFTGHGPATLRDFMWWSGLTAADARRGIDLTRSELVREELDGTEYWMSPAMADKLQPVPDTLLLPPFDEYLVGYKDRSAVLGAAHRDLVQPGTNGMFSPIIVQDGQVTGTWHRSLRKTTVTLTPAPFGEWSADQQAAFAAAAARYARFLGLAPHVIAP